MTDNKYTDEQIIRASECCKTGGCIHCPRWKNEYIAGDCSDITTIALNLINRQKADLERLQTEKDNLIKTYAECRKDMLHEFVGRLKKKSVTCTIPLLGLQTKGEIEEYFNEVVLQMMEAIDKTVKEMTGEITNE